MAKCNIGAIILIITTFVIGGCSRAERGYESIQNVPMLGTTLSIIADLPPDSLGALARAIEQVDSTMKAQMSIFDKNSWVSRINRSECDSLSDDMIYNIRMADSVSRVSGGVYDITVMPLVEAWGFARKGAQDSPNIDSLLEFVGYEKIRIEGSRIVKSDPRIRLDFNSIAKGYTVDKLAQRVAALGAENYLVDIGGEITSRGVNSRGVGWTIGVETPFDGNMSDGEYLQKAISIPPRSAMRAMATSGNYRRFYLSSSGEKICHTIDPKTGRSKSSTLLSATVIAPNCALADAYATMFMAAGSQGAVELAQRIEGVEVYFIFSGEGGERSERGERSEGDEQQEYREFMSQGMKELVKK